MKKITVYGTPIAPRKLLREQLAGASFCVSYGSRKHLGRQLDDAIDVVGDLLLVDNGAFSLYRKKAPHGFDEAYLADYERWASAILERCPQAVAVIPDVIGGTEEQNAELTRLMYAFPAHRAMGIWHLNESLEYLIYLCESYGWVGFGSAGEYWKVGTRKWHARIKEAFAAIEKWEAESEGAYIRPRLHLMRAQSMLHLYDFDSADSTNLAMNHGRFRKKNPGVERHIEHIAARIDGQVQASAGPEAEYQIKQPLLSGYEHELWLRNWYAELYPVETEQWRAAA